MKQINKEGFEKRFYSKLLLFGEYVVIRGAKALAIPYNSYFGHWDISDIPNASNTSLSKLGAFLQDQKPVAQFLDVEGLVADVSEGLYFNSTIPLGYGLGSSGALCAAIYDRYLKGGERETDLGALRGVFRQLEAYFHGKGSGLDPLVCFLNFPLLVCGDEVKRGDVTPFTDNGGAIFLLDTGIQRQTAPLVNLFNEKCLDQNYLAQIDETVVSNNNCIKAYLKGDQNLLYTNWKQVSLGQFQYFEEMIPETLKKQWEEGISDGNYSLKLCGAGGGGFILGITKDYYLTKKVMKDWKLTILHAI